MYAERIGDWEGTLHWRTHDACDRLIILGRYLYTQSQPPCTLIKCQMLANRIRGMCLRVIICGSQQRLRTWALQSLQRMT